MTSRLLTLAAATTIALALAGCSSGEEAAWTYAPPPSATPTPAPTETSATPPSPDTGAPSSGTPSGSEAPAGALTLVAQNIQFDKAELTAPADAAFTLTLDNQDAGVPHNVEILDAQGMSVFKGDIFNGVEKRDYQVPALPAGTYKFVCSVHPNMVGTLTVGG